MTTEQKPLKSGFGAKTTAGEVLAGIDLTGKTAVVTGGYSGVGLETTRALAEAGATVIVPTLSSPSGWTSAARRTMFAPSPYTPAASILT